MALEAGTRVGPYKLISLLGTGGMGDVYLALDTRLGRNVALKFLPTDFTTSDERVRRFQQEARAASKLNHPNLITIFDVGEIESTHFIATEFIEGETLRNRMLRGRMTITEICDIAIQVANALAIAHSAGIMHRDIKPENIMIRPDKIVKVLDFGLAKLTENPARSGDSFVDPSAPTKPVHTEFGMVMGTINYMSPEQARGVKVDARTDVFSLGVVIYEMISGRVPFEGQTYSDVITAILSKRPSTLTRYYPEIPPELERIVTKSLAKDREERYQTIKDMLIDLKKLRQQIEQQEEDDEPAPLDSGRVRTGSGGRSGSGGQAAAAIRTSGVKTQEIASPGSTPSGSTSSAEYLVNSLRRHKRSAVVLMAGLVVAAVGVFYFTTRPRPISSLAVLPLLRPADDQNTRFLTELTAQRLTNDLSQLPGVTVKAFSAVMRYMNEVIDPQAIGRQLDAGAVLIVRVAKPEQSDQLAISLELVNTHDSSTIWGKQYDSRFADLRGVQQEILRSVSARLGVSFSEEEKRRREAERLYQEGRNLWDKRTSEALRQAIDSFEKSIELNPNYALSYAGLADCYNMLATYGAEYPRRAFPEAKKAAEQALRIDNLSAEAHTSLGYMLFRGDRNYADAEREFKRAIDLKPDYGQARQWYANLLSARGRHNEAEAETRRSQELEPTSLIIQSHFGLVYFFAHRYDDSIAACQKVLTLDPNFFAARRYLGWAYEMKGMYREAIAEMRRAVQSANNSPLMRAELGYALGASGEAQNKEEARRLLGELIEITNQRYVSPYHIALVHVALADTDKAFEWLERGLEEKADYMAYLNVDPRFDPIRSDPRFQSLLKRVGF